MSRRSKAKRVRDERDLAALVIRLAVGPMLFAHGYNKVFGSGGLAGTERWFAALGFRPAKVHARLAAATEMATGAAITVGAANPLPSAAVVGLMTVAAATDHKGKGFFVFKGGWEYTMVLGAVAVALAGLGPGRWSVDRLLGRRSRGAKAAAAATVLGLVNAGALMAASYRPAPPETPEA
ncbi:MAG TPA: DoxX family protein [Acidimicrobiales bacterium]|nr:DoxX family protein [Acidimicrobiales bacterium]